VSLTGDNQFTWAASTSDPRALQTPSATGRIASTYYSSGSFKINVNLTDGNAHRVALYLLDWDSTARAETISVLDAATNTVLNTETFSGFHNGQYVSWNVQGNVIIQVTKTGGSNAVVAGIFFDSPFYPTAAATYSGADTTTLGAWTGFYGADGQLIANDAASAAPAYATVTVAGDSLWTWSNSTTDPRALQTASGSATLIASAYYSASSFTIDVNLTDGQLHQIALFLVDWDGTSRSETISVLDAATSRVLDTETFSSFHGGQYAPWNVQGHVLIQVTRTGGVNAVVSGIFFDPPTTTAALYCCYDTQTQGTWTGVYGTSGYQIANDAPDLPASASVSLKGGSLYTWAASTTDVRALQTASGSSNRIASTYYSPTTFTIDVNLRDGRYHGIELYLLDWDSTSRAETISILDAESNAVLDTETYSSFHNGEWADWDVRGHVLIQVTKTGGANAVVSGIFID
jgi:hypothetical protein